MVRTLKYLQQRVKVLQVNGTTYEGRIVPSETIEILGDRNISHDKGYCFLTKDGTAIMIGKRSVREEERGRLVSKTENRDVWEVLN